jgi:hypothetical protein
VSQKNDKLFDHLLDLCIGFDTDEVVATLIELAVLTQQAAYGIPTAIARQNVAALANAVPVREDD